MRLYVHTFILYAENEKPENEQPPAFLPLFHPHATIIGHLPTKDFMTKFAFFCSKFKVLGFPQFLCRSY